MRTTAAALIASLLLSSDGSSPVDGVWTGVRSVRERDGCRLDDAARARRKVTLTVRTAPDGSPVGELVFMDAPEAARQRWRGHVDRDQLQFETTQTMTCGTKAFEYPVRPTGKMPPRAKNRRTTMRLAAEDGRCGCGFDVDYELKWTAP